MQGKRVYPSEAGHLQLDAGDYGQDADGLWWVMTPSRYCGPLRDHDVAEHEDGTITVSPSIMTPPAIRDDRAYHGWLVRGEWKIA